MTNEADHLTILQNYPANCQPQRVDPLGTAGGFSGARFWRLESPRGPLCLRRWPSEHPSAEHLTWIHEVLGCVAEHGFAKLPLPIAASNDASNDGSSFARHGGHLWELTAWMPGNPDEDRPTSAGRIKAAMAALGQFHRAAAIFPCDDTAPAPSPGLGGRLKTLRRFAGQTGRFRSALKAAPPSKLRDLAEKVLNLFPLLAPNIEEQLTHAATQPVRQQPCIRDIHRQHVLFQGETVSGLIDFGAMRVESVAGDVARLMGSLAGDDAAASQTAIDAYIRENPLSQVEESLIEIFDRSGVLLSPINWIEWIFVEKRRFERMDAVLARFEELVGRLESL
ncbi:MAG: phosphotransferase [Planctomycetes bacterium]|nr:phosphotransferase [Planctomycetota bacterium]